ncbi:MAG TPA: hypothetical protein VGL88_00385 [Pseudonocardiaceae bacterium]
MPAPSIWTTSLCAGQASAMRLMVVGTVTDAPVESVTWCVPPAVPGGLPGR